MEAQYSDWIQANVAKTYGECVDVTQRMQDAFPLLERVRGHYYCPVWGERAHWWLVDVHGEIIDPTAGQFPSKGNGRYEPWDDSQEEPTGRCMGCGGYCYGGDSVCSPACEVDVMSEYQC